MWDDVVCVIWRYRSGELEVRCRYGISINWVENWGQTMNLFRLFLAGFLTDEQVESEIESHSEGGNHVADTDASIVVFGSPWPPD